MLFVRQDRFKILWLRQSARRAIQDSSNQNKGKAPAKYAQLEHSVPAEERHAKFVAQDRTKIPWEVHPASTVSRVFSRGSQGKIPVMSVQLANSSTEMAQMSARIVKQDSTKHAKGRIYASSAFLDHIKMRPGKTHANLVLKDTCVQI